MKKIAFLLLLAVAAPSVAQKQPAGAPIVQPKGNRLAVFISDLHLGLGRNHDGIKAWDRREDFRWTDEFKAFLKRISDEGKGRVDLILDGDTFDLWEAAGQECAVSNELGCSEDDARRHLSKVISAHGQEMKALGQFANTGENRVAILPGNHDIALMFPSVAKMAVAACGAKPDRVKVSSAGYWVSNDGLVLADHGSQFDSMNRFNNFQAPFVTRDGVTYLERSWGEQFLREVVGKYESEFPALDNFSSDLEAIPYATKAKGFAGMMGATKKFMAFLLVQLSWRQRGSMLGAEEQLQAKAWDVDRVRKNEAQFLRESFDAAPKLKALAPALLKEDSSGALKGLAKGDIEAICNWRLARGATPCPELPAGGEAPVGALGGLSARMSERSRLAAIGQYLQETYLAEGKDRGQFRYCIFGHTHLEEAPTDLTVPWTLKFLNTGAWQRITYPEAFEEILRDELIDPEDALSHVDPNSLAGCYSFITVQTPADPQSPDPKLRYWAEQGKDSKKWDIQPTCHGRLAK